jgi:hypothetical protein
MLSNMFLQIYSRPTKSSHDGRPDAARARRSIREIDREFSETRARGIDAVEIKREHLLGVAIEQLLEARDLITETRLLVTLGELARTRS